MKNTMRKGFTLVELLFVMAVIAILAGFAIANLKGSTSAANVTAMKNDARNAIAAAQAFYAENQEIVDTTCDNSDSSAGKKCEVAGEIPLNASAYDKVVITEDTGCLGGFAIEVSNANVEDKKVKFNSCTDASISVETESDSN